jgi:hypothetical protein
MIAEKPKMYTFVIEATISMSVEVEASSLLDAAKQAQNASVMSLCHQCARGDDGAWNTSGELDCDPSSSTVVAAYCDGEELDMTEVEELWG